MKILICFDVDGTLETSNGPVTLKRLHQLERDGARVAIVSPSSARPKGFPTYIDGPARADNLRAARTAHPAKLCLYVSDNRDQAEAAAAGFCYIDRLEFR